MLLELRGDGYDFYPKFLVGEWKNLSSKRKIYQFNAYIWTNKLLKKYLKS